MDKNMSAKLSQSHLYTRAGYILKLATFILFIFSTTMGIPCVDRVNRNKKKTSGKKSARNEYKNKYKSFHRVGYIVISPDEHAEMYSYTI